MCFRVSEVIDHEITKSRWNHLMEPTVKSLVFIYYLQILVQPSVCVCQCVWKKLHLSFSERRPVQVPMVPGSAGAPCWSLRGKSPVGSGPLGCPAEIRSLSGCRSDMCLAGVLYTCFRTRRLSFNMFLLVVWVSEAGKPLPVSLNGHIQKQISEKM